MLVLNKLIQSIRSAATHNPDVQVAPACILWPDGDRQWETVIPRLQVDMPELLQLGDFAPDKRIGPAIWLRCVIARADEGMPIPKDLTPIIYLPGVSRQDLRAIESCPEALKPLAELQYRGVIWSQVNAKDWTILAYLKSNQGGLGLDVAQDADSKNAMQLSLFRVLDEELQMLIGRHLDKDYFNTLLSGGDPIRDLLQWLDQGDGFKAGRDENTWRGFVEVCKSTLGIDPEKDGPLKAASLLAQHKGPWNSVDLANRMETRLKYQGFSVESVPRWAALPSVTATAKTAVMPMQHLIRGQEVNADFEPSVASTGQSLKGGYHFKKLLTDNGWQILERSAIGDPTGLAWTEIGDFDREGHARGASLGRYVEAILADTCERISQLFVAGWKTVKIVTDHGCLLMPGGLPKTELPTALSDNTWGRCAAIKPGAVCNENLYQWYWNIDLSFALPPGCSSYKPGKEYTHGGLSLQECLVTTMTVVQSGAIKKSSSIEIHDAHWIGMRCKVAIESGEAGEAGEAGLLLDLRTHAGDASTSKATSVRKFKEDGTGSVVVSDDSLVGHSVVIVVLDKDGKLVAERNTTIGSEGK